LHVTFLRKPAQTRKNSAQFLRKIERRTEKLMCQRYTSKTGVLLPVLDVHVITYGIIFAYPSKCAIKH